MKIIYESISLTKLLRVWTSRIFGLLIIIIAGIHFTENPVAVGFVVTIILVLEIFISAEKIIVYEDKLVYRNRYFFNLYIKDKAYLFYDLKTLETSTNTLKDEFFDLISKFKLSTYLYIQLKEDNLIILRTSISRNEMIKIAAIVNKMLDTKGSDIKIE